MIADVYQLATAGEHPLVMEVIPPPRKLWWLLPDDLLPARYKPLRPNDTQGWPQTVNISTAKETIPLTEELQRFIFALNPGMPPSSFAGLMDTWNKENKVRDCANFITGENTSYPLPKLPTDLLFGCNVVAEVRRFTWGGGMGIEIGEDVIEIESVHPDRLPSPQFLPVWLKHHLTIYHSAMYNGRHKINQFPHNDGMPCFTAIISTSPQYIETARCMAVTIPPSVYNPERI